jgi:hypothetical protein
MTAPLYARLRKGAVLATITSAAIATTLASGASASPEPSGPGTAQPLAMNRWILRGVATDPTGAVWAVGGDESNSSYGPALALRPTGDTWAVDTPSGDYALFDAVAVSDSDDVWAAGTAEALEAPFIEHWDGQSWTRSSAPAQKLPKVIISDLAAVTPTDVYATGRAYDENGNSAPVHLHWNGQTWKNDRQTMAGVVAVSASSPQDAWAVGHTNKAKTLVQHWDGTSWSRVNSPAHLDGLVSVDATGPNDAWAIGGSGLPFIQHWNGSAWSVVPAPGDLDSKTTLSDVAGSSADDIWIAGSQPAGLVEHWDGSTWTRFSTPADGRSGATLGAVSVTSPTDAWIAGTWVGYKHHQPSYHPILMHWDGTSWTLAKLPKV